MLPNRPLRESALPKSEIHVKPFGATRSTFQKAHLCLSSSYAFECDSRDQCLKSKSFFLKLNLKLIMVSYLSVSHLTQVIHDFLSCVSQETAHYENVTMRLCTIHCCVCHVKTSLEEQKSSERASTKR